MGTFSNLFRFREQGQAPNVNNVEEFGQPARSLYTSTKFFSLHQKTEVTDDEDRVAYRAVSKAISIKDKTDILDVRDMPVAHIECKVFSLHERHTVTMADGTVFDLSNEFFHVIKDITNIEGLGWKLKGNILGLNFRLFDAEGKIIAVISQKAISLHDKYCIDIYQTQFETYVIAILITLQHMIRDREASAASSSSSFSSSN